MAEALVNNNMNNGLAQNSMVMIKPKSRWQQSVYGTQQDTGLSGGIDSNLINGGYDASNIAVTGNNVSTPVVPMAGTTVRPANAVGLAAGNGLGDYGYIKHTL